MDIRFLESLIAVSELGSIVATARAQGLTPAAVSQRIQVLERDLGLRLLDRQANAALPTPACRDLLPAMRQLVTQARALEQAARPSEAAGPLKLGAISTVLTALLPDILEHMPKRAPKVELRITPGSSAQLYEALLAGDLDAALLVEPPFDLPDSLEAQVLRREPLCLLAPPACREKALARIFEDLPLLAYDPQSWGGAIAQRYLRDHGLRPVVLCELDALEAISALVARGAGAALVPDWPELQGASPLPDGAQYGRTVSLVTPRTSPRAANLQALRDVIEGCRRAGCTFLSGAPR
ncbi:LysR family transcriptional regulator (plasmid) [Thioclava sp. 'Guangxiensis']|uniref:LysR family transcriptional regulator n=1 Tax=Thioclava sp. 'Guangxiensis' TaxID=3149044 RepID=UPI0032C3E12B